MRGHKSEESRRKFYCDLSVTCLSLNDHDKSWNKDKTHQRQKEQQSDTERHTDRHSC
jgi:hypothetical protein